MDSAGPGHLKRRVTQTGHSLRGAQRGKRDSDPIAVVVHAVNIITIVISIRLEALALDETGRDRASARASAGRKRMMMMIR
jgi:hypothetical protein